MAKLIAIQRLWLKSHPEIDERMIQEFISLNPQLLELGDVVVKDKERRQPHAGRLDLLLQDSNDERRYEVEIQLGETDPSHIIRTLEYWDVERRRFPKFEHCAVLIAEDITSRFLNVMSLFNGTIPFIAIQMSAHKSVDGSIALSFTTVLNELSRDLEEDDASSQIKTTREDWEVRSSKESMKVVDELFALSQRLYPSIAVNYTKGYIGTTIAGKSVNFAIMKPKKKSVRFELFIRQTDEITKMIDDFGFEQQSYNHNFGYYPIRLGTGDAARNSENLSTLITIAYSQRVTE